MKQSTNSIIYLFPILLVFGLAGCGSAKPKAGPPPTQVVFPEAWSELYPGMSPAELTGIMGAQPRRVYTEALDGRATVTLTYYPFTEFVFVNPQKRSVGAGELALSNRLQRCTYAQGDNGAFEASFPLPKERAKELFMNSAAPLGFIAKQLPDEYSTMSYVAFRTLPNLKMEAVLTARFSADTSGTDVYVNTESTELVWKSRDHSYAKSILMHMHCTHSIFEKNYGLAASNAEPAKEESKSIELVNYRMVSSRAASIGDPVEFKIADSAVIGGRSFSKGGSAWGVVSNIGTTSQTGDIITIRLERIQTTNGQWYAIKQEDGSDNVTWQGHETYEKQPAGTIISGHTITVDGPWELPDFNRPLHAIYHIGETLSVVVGQSLESGNDT